MWTCPKCGVESAPSFEICWSCGTSRDGVEDKEFVTADEAGPIDDPVRDHAVKLQPASDPELPEPLLEIVECYRAYDAAEAKFLVDQMANAGIPAVVQGANMGNTEYPITLFAPRVMVRAEDLDRGRAFVEDYDRRKQARQPSAE